MKRQALSTLDSFDIKQMDAPNAHSALLNRNRKVKAFEVSATQSKLDSLMLMMFFISCDAGWLLHDNRTSEMNTSTCLVYKKNRLLSPKSKALALIFNPVQLVCTQTLSLRAKPVNLYSSKTAA